MGYITHANGQIDIAPPLSWAQIKDSEWMPDGPHADETGDIKLVITEAEVDTADGPLFVRQAVGVIQRHEDEPRNYYIVEQLQQLIDAFPEHEFTGRFDCEGESTSDLWRVEIHDRKVVRVEPRIIWPDGSETKAGDR